MDLSVFTLKELQEVAKMAKVKGHSTMKKKELKSALAEVINGGGDVAEAIEDRLQEIDGEHVVKFILKPSQHITELTYNGKTQSIGAWADEVGLSRPTLYDRINRHNWPVKEALTIPKGGHLKTAMRAEAEN